MDHVVITLDVFDFPSLRPDCNTCAIEDLNDVLPKMFGDDLDNILVANDDLVKRVFRENAQNFYTSYSRTYGLRAEPEVESEMISRLAKLIGERISASRIKSAKV